MRQLMSIDSVFLELVHPNVFFLKIPLPLLSTLFPYTTLFRSLNRSGLLAENEKIRPILAQLKKLLLCDLSPSTNDSVKKDRKSGSAGMPRPISYAVFCLKKKTNNPTRPTHNTPKLFPLSKSIY